MARVTYNDAQIPSAQVFLNWRKSSRCPNNATCVEVADLPGGGSAMRDSKDATSPMLMFGTESWAAFLAATRAGEFNPGA